MPTIVAVLSEKGGSGKTTIATNLAVALMRRGETLLVDADPQQSSHDWASVRDAQRPTTVVVEGGSIEDIPRLASSYEYVVIDGAPRLSDLTRQATGVADLVVIPVHPSAADIWSAETVVDLCDRLGTKAALCLSRTIVGTTLTESAREALQSFELPVMDGTAQRVAYVRAINNGRSVLESGDEKAVGEIQKLSEEVLIHTDSQTDIQTDG